MKIQIDHPFGELVLTEDEIKKALDDISFLEHAVLALIDSKHTDSWDCPYTKEQINEFLKDYFLEESSFSNDYIKELLEEQ